MIHKIKNFVACHYLVCAYSMLALVSVLFVLFRNDWKFLVQLIVCLLVILLYAMVCGLGYIFIRAIFADKCFDKATLRKLFVIIGILALLYPFLRYIIKVNDVNMIYLLAPLASWPSAIAVLFLNICTKWSDHRQRKHNCCKQE